MNACSLRTGSWRRFVWALWLALLLLPAAQLMAAAHGLSHADTSGSLPADGKHALQPPHCSLCLIGAAIGGGGAPPAEPPSLTLSTVRHELSCAAFHGVRLASSTHAYQSRAPPPALL